MAYHDANGRITIDENAANRDVQKLKEAVEILKVMKEKVVSAQQTAASFKGQFATSIIDKADVLSRQISVNIDALNNSIANIQYTVRKYRELDTKLKEHIMSSGGGSGAFGSGGGFGTR